MSAVSGPEREARTGAVGVGGAWLLTLVLAFGGGLIVAGVPSGPGGSGIPVATPRASGSGAAGSPSAAVAPGFPSEPGATSPPEPTHSGEASQAPPVPSPDPGESATPSPGPDGEIPTETIPPFAPEDFEIFWQALQLAQENYVDRDALEPTELTYGAIAGLIEALGDTGHSVFLTPEQLASEEAALQGTVVGIGALLGERSGQPAIISVIRGSPADRAGLGAGDIIVSVDGQPVDALSLPEIGMRVRGEEGTTVTIEIIRPETEELLEVDIVRETIDVPAVSSAVVPGTQILHLRLSQFSEGAADELTAALQSGLEAGTEGVILDLRSNPGGLVNEAVGVASQFLAEGVVFQRQNAQGERMPVEVRPGGVATDVPLAVLVDAGSASSSEIVAGGLQDAARAPLIGTSTAGTGTVLNTFVLDDGSAVRIGVEQWLTPSGERIFGEGLEPDRVVELEPGVDPLLPEDMETLTPEELALSDDAQLLAALEELTRIP